MLYFNSGIQQEYTDHSIILQFYLHLFYKILNFLGINEIYKFSQIHNASLNEIFEQNIYYLRLFSILTHITAVF